MKLSELKKIIEQELRAFLDERKLTRPEKRKLKSLEKKVPKRKFTKQYGKKRGKKIYYATMTKMAKKAAEE